MGNGKIDTASKLAGIELNSKYSNYTKEGTIRGGNSNTKQNMLSAKQQGQKTEARDEHRD